MQKVVFITGASSGIGLTTAKFFLNKGYKVYGLSRSAPKEPIAFNYILGDVTDEVSVQNAVKEIMQKENRLDIVINNAGMGISGASEYTSKDEIETIFAVNMFGVVNVCKAVIPYLRKTHGHIINVGSVAGELHIPFQSYYSATKASMQAYSIALRSELLPFNIKVSVVLPGDTKTPFFENRQRNSIEQDKFYGSRIKNSLQVMESDEKSGMPAVSVSKVIYKLSKQKKPSIVKTVGIKYKFFVFLKRILPTRLVNYVIYKIYG